MGFFLVVLFAFIVLLHFFIRVLPIAVAAPAAVGLFKLTEKWTSRGRVLRVVFCTLLAVILYVLMEPFFMLVIAGLLSPGGYL